MKSINGVMKMTIRNEWAITNEGWRIYWWKCFYSVLKKIEKMMKSEGETCEMKAYYSVEA